MVFDHDNDKDNDCDINCFVTGGGDSSVCFKLFLANLILQDHFSFLNHIRNKPDFFEYYLLRDLGFVSPLRCSIRYLAAEAGIWKHDVVLITIVDIGIHVIIPG